MNESRPQLFGMLAGLFLAAGLVLSAIVGTTAWVKITNSQFVTVKGSARKSIESDLAVWKGSFEAEAGTLLEAQHKIQGDRATVEKSLTGAGVTNYSFAAIGIEEEQATHKTADGWMDKRTSGYRLSQAVRVESADVDRIERLDSTPLVEAGVLFTAEAPQFLYTSVGEAKIEMLAEAAKDARARAEQIASQGGRGIAKLHNAGQGIFQITPQHSTETSGEGLDDTTSRQKTITAVVTETFLLK